MCLTTTSRFFNGDNFFLQVSSKCFVNIACAVLHLIPGGLSHPEALQHVLNLQIRLCVIVAFDSVSHQTPMQKMQLLEIPDHAYNWMVTCFEGRGHATKLYVMRSRELRRSMPPSSRARSWVCVLCVSSLLICTQSIQRTRCPSMQMTRI